MVFFANISFQNYPRARSLRCKCALYFRRQAEEPAAQETDLDKVIRNVRLDHDVCEA